MSPITTHVLDTSLGRPAQGVTVILDQLGGKDDWIELGRGTTNADGRITDLLPDQTPLTPGGIYRLRFFTAPYFASARAFYPEIPVVFQIDEPEKHYHVPLLLSPFGYSTYRGS